MNFKNQGQTLAVILDKNKQTSKTVSLDDKIKDFEELDLKDDFQFQQIPNQNRERDVLYISGKSGSGKSYYALQFLKQYKKLYPKRPIYLFSYLDQDDTLDEFKQLKRIDIYHKEFLTEEMQIDELKESCVIFDDIDNIEEKKLKLKVFSLLSKLLTMGRHSKTTVLFCNHEPNDRDKTKSILSECDTLTIFPRNLGKRKMKYLLENYFGLDKTEIEKLSKLDSRWVTIYKTTYPNVVMSQTSIYTL